MRILYIVACCFLLAAVVLDIAGKDRFSFAARCRARSLEAESTEKEQIKQESKAALALGNRLAMGGMVAAAGGLLVWIASAMVGLNQKRRWTPLLPLGLLAAYILLFFVYV
jgi:hypothetical protein